MRRQSDDEVRDEIVKLDMLIGMLQARRFELSEDLVLRAKRTAKKEGV